MLIHHNRMSFCPLDAQTGFIQLSGPIDQSLLTQIQAISAPFTASFSPRQNKPLIQGPVIDDGTNNTILYNSIRYQLASYVQVCKPSHTGYVLPGMSAARVPEMELVLTYTNLSAGGSYPTGILVILPIYSADSGSSQRANYLRQFLGDAYPTATLQSIFAMSYMTCVDILEGQNRKKTYLRCFYFPRGIELAPREYASFKAMVTTGGTAPLPNFRLIPILRYETGRTVLAYTIGEDGQKVPTETSSTGEIAKTQLSTAAAGFKTKFQYFTKPITITGPGGENTCPYYPTSKYKCVPFNTLRDLSGNQVIPGGTGLDRVIEEQEEAQGAIVPPPVGVSNFTKWLGIAVGVIGGLVLLAGAVYLFKKMGSAGSGAGTKTTNPRGTAKDLTKVLGSVATATATATALSGATPPAVGAVPKGKISSDPPVNTRTLIERARDDTTPGGNTNNESAPLLVVVPGPKSS